VQRPPVITMVATHCNMVNCLVTLAEPMAFGPGCSVVAAQADHFEKISESKLNKIDKNMKIKIRIE